MKVRTQTVVGVGSIVGLLLTLYGCASFDNDYEKIYEARPDLRIASDDEFLKYLNENPAVVDEAIVHMGMIAIGTLAFLALGGVWAYMRYRRR